MSENIRGVTFAEQTVTPADDAIVRRAILSDGILSGCNITYSGSTLTMAAGYMIVCGRIFQITAAQNWAVVDATSGVARLVLTIDLTKTATESAFDQIGFSIEYASAEDGFVNLTQDDINIAGVRYQVAVAVVSLGAGGITGIVSKLEKAEGGGGLNFKVVADLTQPGSATENTIWVMAEKIGAYYFSATQPENMQEWDVWFPIGTSSTVSFNALKKNTLEVYPLSAKQIVGGVLTDVTAKSYQNRAWMDWWNGQLFDAGNQFEFITGGWESVALTYSGGNGGLALTVSDISGGIRLTQTSGGKGGIYKTKKKVSLKDKSFVYFTGEIYKNSAYVNKIGLTILSEIGSTIEANSVAAYDAPVGTTSYKDQAIIDVKALTGEYYIAFYINSTDDKYIDLKQLRIE